MMTDYVLTQHGVEKCRGTSSDCLRFLLRDHRHFTLSRMIEQGWKILPARDTKEGADL